MRYTIHVYDRFSVIDSCHCATLKAASIMHDHYKRLYPDAKTGFNWHKIEICQPALYKTNYQEAFYTLFFFCLVAGIGFYGLAAMLHWLAETI